jgi:hypothetical protein
MQLSMSISGLRTTNPPEEIWHGGPPPSLGWWPVGTLNDKVNNIKPVLVAWWNGKHWSPFCWKGMELRSVNIRAAQVSTFSNDTVYWADRPSTWPKESFT